MLITTVTVPTIGVRLAILWKDCSKATVTSPLIDIVEETESDKSFFKGAIAALTTGGAAC